LIFLRIVGLATHLMLMNFALAAPFFAIWIDSKATAQNSDALHRFGRYIGWMSLGALIAGIVVGVLQGTLIWLSGESSYFAAIQSLWDSKIVFGIIELVFSILCMAGYLIWWKVAKRVAMWQRIASRLLAILAATNLLYHFPTLFTIIGLIARGEVDVAEEVSSADFRVLLLQGEVIWLTLHVWLASVAVAGQFVGWLAISKLPEDDRNQVASVSHGVALIVTMLQVPTGFMLATFLNRAAQSRLMGGDSLATALFLLGIGLAFWLMHAQATVAGFQQTRAKSNIALFALAATIVTMTATMIVARM